MAINEMKTRRNRPEEALQRTVAQYLDLALPKDAIWFHVPNGGARSKAEAGAFKAMGVKAGVPDILILRAGQAHFIELKADSRVLSGAQEIMHDDLEAAGFNVETCRSLEEVEATCRTWSLMPTVKVRAG